jgi:hypothetical protein
MRVRVEVLCYRPRVVPNPLDTGTTHIAFCSGNNWIELNLMLLLGNIFKIQNVMSRLETN